MNSEKRLPMSTWESFVNKKTKVRKSKEKDKCITNSNCFVKLKNFRIELLVLWNIPPMGGGGEGGVWLHIS